MVTRFCDLTEKVVAEIMSLLPPKCLVQCKCVQKSWNILICNLINKQWFMTKLVGSRSVFLMGIFPRFSEIVTENRVVNSFNACNNKNEIRFESVEFSCTSRPINAMAYYSTTHCNGIICMAEVVSKKITLCNPITREFKYLDMDSSTFFGSRYLPFLVGFGYDAIADVYKVVQVVCQSTGYVAEVSTLGTNTSDSSWRRISMINIGNHLNLIYPRRALYHKGFIYWSVCLDEKIIISFDIHEEKFQILPPPSPAGHMPDNNVLPTKVQVWLDFRNECITLVHFKSSEVEMWTMKTDSCCDSGNESFLCWVKNPSFPPPPLPKYRPELFLSSDQLIMSTKEIGQPISYNIHTYQVSPVQLCPAKLYHSYIIIPYVKTLVSLNQF